MLNPIAYTEKVIHDFLRYQLTTYPFADPALYDQMRRLLSLRETRQTPLLKGPYVHLSSGFREGAAVAELVAAGILHPHMARLIPYPALYGHQETAIRAIHAGRTTLVSTGTGSGKTESFLYPIISHCLRLRDQNAPPGIVAVIVYPMNALAEDQLLRLRGLLAGTGITFGMYIGKTPERAANMKGGTRLAAGSSRADYLAAYREAQRQKKPVAVHPPEERCARQEMRAAGQQPRLLLTNVKQLELLLTRRRDIEMFDGARLDYLVFDEAHTFSGANGAETACLIRRLRAFCGRAPEETVCIATSATIIDPADKEPGRNFAARFFGVDPAQVALVQEEYDRGAVWSEQRSLPPPPSGDPVEHLPAILAALEAEEAGQAVGLALAAFSGQSLDPANWRTELRAHLSANELVYRLVQLLADEPRTLFDLVKSLAQQMERPVSEEEVLAWLALGAAARQGGRPFLRPVVHGFVRGVGGAVVTFPPDEERPRLWLSAEMAPEQFQQERLYPLPVATCTTCGQHYFIHHVQDFTYTGSGPEGGQQVDQNRVWPSLEATNGGRRVVLLDRLITADTDEEEAADMPGYPLYLCRACGALHLHRQSRCAECGRAGEPVLLYAAGAKEDSPGYLSSCLACRARGGRRVGRYREPIRAVRAVTVSDVHVLAQNMIHHALRKRLLVFADNRQDAAFQAGWMEDHARRFRLRSLMHEQIQAGPLSVGDLTARLDRALEKDDDLSRTLIPEVWRAHPKEAAGLEHATERKYFLRIQVLRELTTGVRQRLGLEPWGRIQVNYLGLEPDCAFIRRWAGWLDLSPDILADGIAALLDITRRGGCLLDRHGHIFSAYQSEGQREIQRGYISLMPNVPHTLRLRRDPNHNKGRVKQWLTGSGHNTRARQVARNWGAPDDQLEPFLEGLWHFLTEELALLAPVVIHNQWGKPAWGFHDVYQIDGDKLLIAPHRGVYRCQVCRRAYNRPVPHMRCMAWQCRGYLEFEAENPDDYDLMVLDQTFTMVRAREHSGQIPAYDREVLERMFKSDSRQVNTLVCTPTLELGVDIGSLDSVLMRNVPPLPANYWQRVGRAGREHRMAVNLTYARPASHDQAYYRVPLRLLQGQIAPPRFNLRNALMVEKHIHAVILTALHQMVRSEAALSGTGRSEIGETLQHCFPRQIRDYLFDANGYVRDKPLDVSALTGLIVRHRTELFDRVQAVFAQGWPAEAGAVVTEAALDDCIQETEARLCQVIERLWKRLQWALSQMAQLEELRRKKGTLDPDEDALRYRCDRLVKRLKGMDRRRSQAEGHDDINTYSVLAAEGFLPGYGLDIGAIRATAQSPPTMPWLKDFDLPRPPAIALREYVPGNLIYANGHRYVPRFYHLEPDEPLLFQVDVANEAVQEVGAETSAVGPGLGAINLKAIPICEVDLVHQSHISDEEDYRFQLAVSIFGYEQGRHGEGQAYHWGEKLLLLRRNVHLRLLNVGVAGLLPEGRLGYPVCPVTGQSRSPLASDADREKFAQDRLERYGQAVEDVGFFADVVADALTLADCATRQEAYSVIESLRQGAAQVLEMEIEDLQVLVIGRPGSEAVDVMLYDPMPGGSGLLEQMLAHWSELIQAALTIVNGCPADCAAACIDCLYTFRNAFYHRYLNRHHAARQLEAWGRSLVFSHEIPPNLPTAATEEAMPVNEAESRLLVMLQRAGFPDPQPQRPLDLGKPLGVTTPDFYYEDPADMYAGVCIYLDGMSRHIHGNKATQQRDHQIRTELRNREYKVISIPYGDLSDRAAMAGYFYQLGRILVGRSQASRIQADTAWFEEPSA